MANTYEGVLDGEGRSIAIVVGRFNGLFSEQLLRGCLDGLRRHGVAEDAIDVAWVPGAMEIPLVCQRMAESGRYDAVIALGAVIRGGTPHFDFVAGECASGLTRVALDRGVPVTFGVLTTDDVEQAVERAATDAGNKGFDVAMAAIEMAQTRRALAAHLEED